MTTRNQRREQARQERQRAEAESAAAERRRRMIQYGAGAFFFAVVVIGVLIAVSQSGSDSDAGGDAASIDGVDRVTAELAGLPQEGISLGDPDAKVTVTEFGDLQCPVCAAFSEQVLPDLLADEIEPGNARLEFKNFVIIGPESEDAAQASLAAAEQGRYWEFVELFYANQGAENSGFVTDDFLRAVADAAGVEDLERFDEDREGDAIADELAATQEEALGLGIDATPTFVVDGPGGTETLVSPSLDQLSQAIADAG